MAESQSPSSPERKQALPPLAWLTIGAGAAILLVIVIWAISRDGDDGATTLEEPTEVASGPGETEGEIFLEPAGSLGPDPFTGEVFVDPVVTTTSSIVTTTTEASTTTADEGTAVIGRSGDQPGLYGGTQDDARCEKAGVLEFLKANPALAQAWVDAQNADVTLNWDGNRISLTVADLDAFFAELTPVMLLDDTRVTNHGYRDGRPTPRQSVLQAGTAVLVDKWGVPRARCACGNPLTPPIASPVGPDYVGDRWGDFDPTIIIVINNSTTVLVDITLINVYTGDTFVRPAGTDGSADTDPGGIPVPPPAGDDEAADVPPADLDRLTEGIDAIEVTGAYPPTAGIPIDSVYDSASFTVFIDPNEIDWIAFSGVDYLQDRGTGVDQSVKDGQPDILFPDVDDHLLVTASKDGVNASLILHDRDAMGTPIGNQAVIAGTYPSVWYVSSIDWSTDPPTSDTATGPETGQFTTFFQTQGPGEYEIQVSFVNTWTDRVAHGPLYLLLGRAIS